MDNEKPMEVWVNLNKPVDNDPRRSDVIECRGNFFRVLSIKNTGDEGMSEKWTLVNAQKVTVEGRQAPLFVMVEKAT
jgi:hypothetical protein